MKRMIRVGIWALALTLMIGLMIPAGALAADVGGGEEGPDYSAQDGDITVDDAPIVVDDANGNVTVRLYLRYKGSDLITSRNLSMLEIEPQSSTNPEKFPFVIDWARNIKKLADVREENYLDRGEGGATRSQSYIDFPFKVHKDAMNGTYQVVFDVRFLSNYEFESVTQPHKSTVAVYVKIEHGKPVPTPTPSPTQEPNPTPKPQAKVILQKYVMDPIDVVGGDSFDLTLVLENTHANMAVRNMKCSISELEGMVLPESGSSTFFIDRIAAKSTHEVTLRMQALPEAGIKPIKMTLALEYDDNNGNNVTKEEFTLPIHQVIKVQYDEPIYTTMAYVDEPFNLRLQFYNVGKAAMYNTMINVESDTIQVDESLFAGTVEAGGQVSYDVMLTVPYYLLSNAQPVDPNAGMEDPADPGVDDVGGQDFDTTGGKQPRDLPAEGSDDILANPETPADTPPPVEPDGEVGSALLVGQSASLARGAIAVPMPVPSMGGGGGGGVSTMQCVGNIVVTYEDNFGTQYRKELPLSVSIQSFNEVYGNDPYMGLEYDYETGMLIDRATGQLFDPVTMEPIERGTNPMIFIGIGGGALVAAVIVLLIILRVRKARRRKAEMEMLENEMD